MKKSLVALAALAATSAFAQFSIDGNMDVAYGSVNYKGNTVTGIINNGANTSQINFRGTENLGGGLKASFRVETDWNTVSNAGNQGSPAAASTPVASAFGNGELRAGIAGGFGAIDAGAVNNAQLTAFLTGQPFGTAIGSSFRGQFVNDTSAANGVRFDNSVRYTTPSFSGFSGTVLNVSKNTKATDTQTFSTTFGNFDYAGVSEYSLNYNQGPINATFASTKQDYAGVGTNNYTTQLKTIGANYTMGALTLYALNQKRTKSDSSVDRTMTTVSAKYSMGPNSFMAQMGSGKDAGTSGNSQTTRLASLGYNYDLSKMSNIYVRYENINDAGVTSGNWISGLTGVTMTEAKRTRTAVGYKIGF